MLYILSDTHFKDKIDCFEKSFFLKKNCIKSFIYLYFIVEVVIIVVVVIVVILWFLIGLYFL
jgi:hypothetical protein